MTDQELKDLVGSLAVSQARTDEKFADLAATQKIMQAEVAETSRVIKEVGRRMGAMASNQGDVAEEFFFNSLGDKPVVGGISFDSVTKNRSVRKDGKNAEFDIVLENGASMAVVEVKYKVHSNDLQQVISQMKRYREFYPAHKNHKLYGGIAGFSIPEEVVQEAHEQGLFVLKRKGEVLEMDAQAMREF